METATSAPLSAAARPADPRNTWKPLSLLNAYRGLVAGGSLILLLTGHLFAPLGLEDPGLFATTAFFYLLYALVAALMIRAREPDFPLQVAAGVGVDVLSLTLLMHASGGVNSGLGMLLLVPVAGGAMLERPRTALVFAALATVAVLGEQVFRFQQAPGGLPGFAHAGLLGATYFTAAAVVTVLARRIRESEELAHRRGVDLANMAELTDHIIQRMQTGIVVVDEDDRVRFMNEAAWSMLGMPPGRAKKPLAQVAPELAERVAAWREHPDATPAPIQPTRDHAALQPRMARISRGERSGVLVFLEDTAATAQQAQQLKLASLGRLTASIAHEIRNPLGAISHAGQLLGESPNLDEHDTRLIRIIRDQSRRMNDIVESVLSLSRRDRASPEVFPLRPFLEDFAAEFRRHHGLGTGTLTLEVDPPDLQVRFDRGQLHQILTNLCENALRHAGTGDTLRVELVAGLTPEARRPFLDVRDNGPGLDADTVEHVFEPFFTTAAGGTGLGLYISRELAEANQAHINYIAGPGGGCFRISFQDPRRHIG